MSKTDELAANIYVALVARYPLESQGANLHKALAAAAYEAAEVFEQHQQDRFSGQGFVSLSDPIVG